MFYVKYLFNIILLRLIIASPQINLYYIDEINQNSYVLQHDCLRIVARIEEANINRQIMTYCMSELPSKLNIQNDNDGDRFPKFTFDELSKQNITSEQLYLWSVPIDLIEDYQIYLNQSSITANNSFLETKIFYNCTIPRFGPMCQYEFDYYQSEHSSLYEIIRYFYETYWYTPSNLTCYIHVQCNSNWPSVCLDWSDICNGRIDCLNDEIDEKYCYQLDINTCKDDEYQCTNGQCIPQSFFDDDGNLPDCLDASDEYSSFDFIGFESKRSEPSFGFEDIICEMTPLTSSCKNHRIHLLTNTIFSIKDKSISKACWSALTCLIDVEILPHGTCNDLCRNNACVKTIQHTCPDMLYIPAVPLLFGHIYFAYRKNASQHLINVDIHYPYVCYNNSIYDAYFVNASKIFFNDTACYYLKNIRSLGSDQSWRSKYLAPLERDLWEYYQVSKNNQNLKYIAAKCNRSNMYQCVNSLKCISKILLNDIQLYCPRENDTNIVEYIDYLESDLFPETLTLNYEKIKKKIEYVINQISFQTICDGFNELSPKIIDGRNETDETECEQWECNNIYTRCDGIWNCPNAIDEIDCNISSSSSCPLNKYRCVSPHTNQLVCLSLYTINDGNLDCLGGIDELNRCPISVRNYRDNAYFSCMNDTIPLCLDERMLCNGVSSCSTGYDDEQFCENRTHSLPYGVCTEDGISFRSDVEKFFCNYTVRTDKQIRKYFTIDEMMKSSENLLWQRSTIEPGESIPIIRMSRCYRGFDLHVWLNNKTNVITCLCPPSYYGNRCQYQNQRISLVIQFRALSDSLQTLFVIVISLIDDSNQRIIHSYEQISYLSMRDCKIKFNMYLLYSTRPKDSTKNYSIHIDIYEKHSLTYRGSLLYPVNFPFLPVHRLAFILDIPQRENNDLTCTDRQCNHGKCIRYSNNPRIPTFCQCEQGWSGRYCTIQHNCTCSSDSLCLGISANTHRSICICPLHKFGSRCLLNDTTCQTNNNNNNDTCQNGGQCISNDDHVISNQKFVCICLGGYHGDRCQFNGSQIILSFDKDVLLSQSMFIHFIEIKNNSDPIRLTTFRTILIRQDLLMINWSRPFHLVFIELFTQNYYLIDVQKTYRPSEKSFKLVKLSDRCPNISEVFNETVLQLHLLRRIKYYHLPCQNQSLNLSCFYDQHHLCLCYDFGLKRLANCFEFQHNKTYSCSDENLCQNADKCFQDDPNCPTRSICICRPCYYGTQCHLHTNGFGLSLDAILGYHILPYLNLNQQPFITQISLILTIIFIIAGLINGFLSLITFKNKTICEVGCGIYLLMSSINSLFIILIFGLKFFILLLAQMSTISNRIFLQVQCHSFDFILRVSLSMDQWLNACVAFERAFTIIKGIGFVKKNSKRTAKFVSVILWIIIIGSWIHDPIYRHLIDEENLDDNVKRIWCVVKYPSGLEIYNYTIHIVHCFGPFLINLFSSFIFIRKKSHQQAHIHKKQLYKVILRQQLRQHKDLLTAPIVLIILTLPRLIIAFISKCMKSADDVWLYLVGYFISFIPPMLTFIIFVLPSEFYRKEFCKTFDYYRTRLRQCFH